jgi:tRNA A37 threonylcarbamoyladenosine dehydratase
MGTGNKMDPSKLEITTLDKTEYDPIAKILRKYCRDNKINKKIIVLSSKERPIKTNDKTVGSNSFVPASAGLLITSYIIKDLI